MRPLINMAGSAGFNEVFFENVRVPARNLVGEENRGWYIGTTTLDFERSSIGSSVGIRKSIESIIRFTKDTPSRRWREEARSATGVRGPLIEANVAKLMSYRVVSMQNAGLVPNHEASMCKLFGSEMRQRIAALGVKLTGMYSQVAGGPATCRWRDASAAATSRRCRRRLRAARRRSSGTSWRSVGWGCRGISESLKSTVR